MNPNLLEARLRELTAQSKPATREAISTVRWLLGTVPDIELRANGGLILQWEGSQGNASVFIEPDGKIWP